MGGSLWLEGKQQRLAEIRGHLVTQVKFGVGLLFFKTIGVQQDDFRSNFQPVPDDLSIAQGLQILRKQAARRFR